MSFAAKLNVDSTDAKALGEGTFFQSGNIQNRGPASVWIYSASFPPALTADERAAQAVAIGTEIPAGQNFSIPVNLNGVDLTTYTLACGPLLVAEVRILG